MASVAEHYDRLLGPVYSWMIGSPEEAATAARAEVAALALPRRSGTAVDLGAGLGFHALALAEAGYETTAIDTSADLLAELQRRTSTAAVHAVADDLLAFRRHAPGPLDAVLCMGDTLTHLPSRTAVEALIGDVAAALAPGGVFHATFRDYTTALEGETRFIPVRRDETRTLTVFLEYAPAEVTVHDLLHERGPDGWRLRVSSYQKLRLDPAWVAAVLQERGLVVERGVGARGMTRLTGTAP